LPFGVQEDQDAELLWRQGGVEEPRANRVLDALRGRAQRHQRLQRRRIELSEALSMCREMVVGPADDVLGPVTFHL